MPRPRNPLPFATRPLAALTLLLSAWAAPALAQETSVPITYQGSLSNVGAPADGPHDLTFRLYDSAVGGSQIGDEIFLEGVEITAGLFTVQLDFGENAWSQASPTAYLEIDAAPEGSPSQTLSPRQPITPAPIAVHTLSHPLQATTDPTWGNLLRNAESPSRLLLNRITPLNTGDYLTLDVPAAAGFLGGMLINHQSPTGSPYYAYATGGNVTAFTYAEPTSDTWRVYNGGDKLTIDSVGNVEATTRFVAPEFAYDDPKPRTLSVSFAAFHGVPADNWEYVNFGTGGATGTFATGFAPLTLPDGAVVTNAIMYFLDDSSIDMELRLYRQSHATGVANSLAGLFTSGSSSNIRTDQAAGRGFTPFSVDNDTYHYFLQLTTVNDTLWLGTTKLKSVQILYTVPEPD